MDESRTEPSVATNSQTAFLLQQYFASDQNMNRLYGILHSYVRTARIVPATKEAENDATSEILNNTVQKALEIADKFQKGSLQAWLLSIASNLVKQKKAQVYKHHQNEAALSDLYGATHDLPSEEAFFDRITSCTRDNFEQNVALREQLETAFSQLSEDDQKVLKLSLIQGFNHNEIAQMFEIKPVTARVRFSRALSRLHIAWAALENGKRGDSDV